MTQSKHTGCCLCGAVRFELAAPLRDVIVCHCRQCAQWTGYAVAATAVGAGQFTLLKGADVLTWFRSSDHAERGFCAKCGSSLFWKPKDGARISVLAGALDPPTGLKIAAHIFMDSRSDFDEVVSGAPQFGGSAGALGRPPDTT